MDTVIIDEQDLQDLKDIESRVDRMIILIKKDDTKQAFLELLMYLKTGVPQK